VETTRSGHTTRELNESLGTGFEWSRVKPENVDTQAMERANVPEIWSIDKM
jgi:hypothetical protein